VRNALKAIGAVLAVIALCSPLMFWPAEDAQTRSTELAQATVTVTVAPTVVVTTTLPPGETTTTSTTEVSAEPSTTTTTTEPPVVINIAAVGDVMPHMPIINSAKVPGVESYDFRPVFAPVARYLAGADYTVANLESRIAGAEFGYSGYPRFNAPESLAYALKVSGVDMVATANNHTLDFGWEGIVNTLDNLERLGLAHVGTHRSLQEKRTPFIVDIKGVKVAFLNYTSYLNGLVPPPEHEAYAVNRLAVDAVAEEAMTARMWGAEIVIALLHYGDEYERTPSESQMEVSQEILSRGVDVILGSHPHVVQPIGHFFDFTTRRVNDKYVVYSMGNFVSSQRWRYSDSGMVAYVRIEKKGLRAYVTGVSYLPVYVQRSTDSSPVRYRVLPVWPGSRPETDTVLTDADRERMAQVWEEVRELLYRPNENIVPLNPRDLRR
jgi:poly-gamma-glutamate capsule biosynthesis protein CapA/YwtB (metallophosphatase superfamily)